MCGAKRADDISLSIAANLGWPFGFPQLYALEKFFSTTL